MTDLIAALRRVVANLRDVELEEVVRHLESSDAQTPDADEAAEFTWKMGTVRLSEIELSPNPTLSYRANDPDLLKKVRRSFEGPEDSVKHAEKLMKIKGLPAVILIGNFAPYHILDGFHRVLAAALSGSKEIEAYVGETLRTARS